MRLLQVPVMFYSGALVARLTELGVFGLTFACFALRNVWYSELTVPEWVYPAELLHGITFGAGVFTCLSVAFNHTDTHKHTHAHTCIHTYTHTHYCCYCSQHPLPLFVLVCPVYLLSYKVIHFVTYFSTVL